MDNRLLGNWGEQLAGAYLRKKGYRLVSRNFSCRFGEIDLIAEGFGCIVFAEVKLRKDAGFAQAREFVTRRKQERIITTASIWLSRYPSSLQPRFDVIEIYAPQGVNTRRPEIIHIEDAFHTFS